MITIYGLRQRGDHEVRYIGRTRYALDRRLRKHQANAAHHYPASISDWIKQARDVEIVPLTICCDVVACAEERRIVHIYHEAGHRLTNSHLMPKTPTPSATGNAA